MRHEKWGWQEVRRKAPKTESLLFGASGNKIMMYSKIYPTTAIIGFFLAIFVGFIFKKRI